VPGIDLEAYQRSVLKRFATPRISDLLSRLCGRGSTKMPAYLLPSLREARQRGRPALLLTLAVAAWFLHRRGYDLNGNPIEVNDARRDELRARAVVAGNDPRPLLGDRTVFGRLGDDVELVTTLECTLHDLVVYGAAATICDYLAAELLGGDVMGGACPGQRDPMGERYWDRPEDLQRHVSRIHRSGKPLLRPWPSLREATRRRDAGPDGTLDPMGRRTRYAVSRQPVGHVSRRRRRAAPPPVPPRTR
jgi:hypothetical protein